MSWQELAAKISMSRRQMGANEAFHLTDERRFHVVESGYVDLFAVLAASDSEHARSTTKPFVARMMPGDVFFGVPAIPALEGNERGTKSYILSAVPSRQAVLLSGERERMLSADDFSLDVVVLIDNWIQTASKFVASHETPPLARKMSLLDADPKVHYQSDSALSAHHLEILWVTAECPSQFVGRAEFPIGKEVMIPVSEHTWLTLSEDALVSAVHTPGAILSGRIWEALDQFNIQIVRCGERYWRESVEKTSVKQATTQRSIARARMALTGGLSGLLGKKPDVGGGEAAAEDALFMASRIVAEEIGVAIDSPAVPIEVEDPIEAVEMMVGTAGIRVREVKLAAGWERREGPSFLGGLRDGGADARPVAVINKGYGVYQIRDPATGGRVPVNREMAKKLGPRGLLFYPPLPAEVDNGVAAIRHVMRGRGRDILGVILMGCLGAIIALLTPILTGELLAEIIPRVDVPLWSAALGALALGALVSAAFAIVGALCMLRLEARVDESLQAAVWNRLLSLPLPFFGQYLAGDLADRANGVSLIRQMLTGAVGGSILSGIFSLFSYALLFYYSWELALWSGVAVLAMAGMTWFFAKHQIRHTRSAIMIQGRIDALVFQMIRGLAKIRQAHAEAFALERWSGEYLKQKRAQLSARKWAVGQLTFNALFMPTAQIALLGLIWFALIEGDTPTPFALSDFLSFYAAFGQFVGGVTGLTAALVSAISVLPLFERIQPILEARPESVESRVMLPRPAGQIEFRNVSFRYPGAEVDVLRNVSFQIGAGEYVAFVGGSGAGKSTVYRLMLGFERPTIGTVLVDGHDLATLDLSALRKHMGVVLQDGQLLPDNIHNNIAGHSHLTNAQVREVVSAVGLEEDIEALPMKLRTVLPESGAGLSGGQKQRLLVARALAQKPSILLLDEATSMLDNRAQDAVRGTLRRLNSTRILIAHRLSTVIDADRIYVMRDGRIIETGSYRELMERDGEMAEMARRQII